MQFLAEISFTAALSESSVTHLGVSLVQIAQIRKVRRPYSPTLLNGQLRICVRRTGVSLLRRIGLCRKASNMAELRSLLQAEQP